MTTLLLYQRIAQQLAEDIRRGVYQPGERVPSVRKMSSHRCLEFRSFQDSQHLLDGFCFIGKK